MQKLKSFFRKIFERTDAGGLSVFGHGYRFDWNFLIIFFFVIILGGLLFSIHVFLGVRAGDLFQTQNAAATPPALINRKGLETILQSYATRAQNLKNLQTARPTLVDPSR